MSLTVLICLSTEPAFKFYLVLSFFWAVYHAFSLLVLCHNILSCKYRFSTQCKYACQSNCIIYLEHRFYALLSLFGIVYSLSFSNRVFSLVVSVSVLLLTTYSMALWSNSTSKYQLWSNCTNPCMFTNNPVSSNSVTLKLLAEVGNLLD